MPLGLINNLSQQDEQFGFIAILNEPYSTAGGSSGEGGLAESAWTEGTGSTVDYSAGYATVASDGTANRSAHFVRTVTPNTTYEFEYKTEDLTDLSDAGASGTVQILYGTSVGDETYGKDTITEETTNSGTIVVGDITTLYITVKVVTASRKIWIKFAQIWEAPVIGVTRVEGNIT